MLKKFFAGLMAAGMLLATSCQEQEFTPALGDATVTFEVATPEIATRAYSDGQTANQLQYAVYHNGIKSDLNYQPVTVSNGKASFNQSLTAGETYTIILWADYNDSSDDTNDAPYTVTFTDQLAGAKMEVNYDGVKSNNENLDAFYAVKEFTVNGAQTETVELKRPFAQLNIGTNDYKKAKDASGYEPTESSVKVKGIYNTLNLANGTVSGAANVTFDFAAINKGETFPYDDTNYDYVAMNYVLVGPEFVGDEGKSLVDVQFTVAEANNVNLKTRTVSSVPVQRNYRTNIYGSLLTSDVDVNVEIKPEYGGITNVSVWDGVTLLEPNFDNENNIYEIYEAAELAYIAQLVNGTLDPDNVTRAAVAANSLKGCTIKLMNDIDLAGEEWTPIGYGKNHFQGTLEGNGHIIHGLKVAERRDTRAALIGTVSGTVAFRNLTIKGASIDCPDFDGDFYGSALIGTAYGNVTIKNVHVVDSYISGNNKVGALLAHDGVVSSLNITDCEVYNTKFEALNEEDGGLVGGLVGYFQGQANGEYLISNSTVKKCTFNVVNSTNTGKRANGQLMGGLDSKAGQELYITDCTIENNTWNEKFYEDGTEVTQNTFVSPYGAWIGGERDDDAKGRVIIDGSDLVLTQAMLDKALTENAIVYLANGEYTINGNFPAGATIIGVGENVTLNIQDKIYTVNGTATIENVKVVFSNNGYKGFQGGVDLNFKECTIEGQPFLYGTKATFEGCTFVQNDPEQYNVWTYAVLEANFVDCVFNCAGKSILVYSEANDLVQKVNFNGCTFNASAPYDGKAAIEIGTSQLTTGMYNVTINDTDVNNFANGSVSGNPVWNVKNGNRAHVIVDGVISNVGGADKVSDGLWKNGTTYSVTNAEGLASINSLMAEDKAGVGITINLLDDIDFTGKTWTPVRSHIDWKSTMNEFNGNGNTISNLTINGAAMFTIFANTHDVVVKNVTFDNAKVTCNGINSAIIVGQTYNNLLLEDVDVKNSTITGNYKVATLIGTVYNEASTTVTATLKNCDVTNTTVKSTQYDFCTTGMVSFVNANDNDMIQFENCTISDVKLYGPTTYGYKAHAAIYTTGSEELFNEAEGVTVTNVTFENI